MVITEHVQLVLGNFADSHSEKLANAAQACHVRAAELGLQHYRKLRVQQISLAVRKDEEMGLGRWPELSPFTVMWRRRWGCGLCLSLLLLALLLLLPNGQPPQQAEPSTNRYTPQHQDRHLTPQHSPLELIPFDSFSADQFIVVTERAARTRRRAYRLLGAAKRGQEAGESTRLLLLDPPPPADQRQLELQGLERSGFNEVVSERISLHRSLPEVRHP
eukprot:g41058.t1